MTTTDSFSYFIQVSQLFVDNGLDILTRNHKNVYKLMFTM